MQCSLERLLQFSCAQIGKRGCSSASTSTLVNPDFGEPTLLYGLKAHLEYRDSDRVSTYPFYPTKVTELAALAKLYCKMPFYLYFFIREWGNQRLGFFFSTNPIENTQVFFPVSILAKFLPCQITPRTIILEVMRLSQGWMRLI